jgi:hypothetical protein
MRYVHILFLSLHNVQSNSLRCYMVPCPASHSIIASFAEALAIPGVETVSVIVEDCALVRDE